LNELHPSCFTKLMNLLGFKEKRFSEYTSLIELNRGTFNSNSNLNVEMLSSIYMNKYEYQNQYLFSIINSRAFETHRLIFSTKKRN